MKLLDSGVATSFPRALARSWMGSCSGREIVLSAELFRCTPWHRSRSIKHTSRVPVMIGKRRLLRNFASQNSRQNN